MTEDEISILDMIEETKEETQKAELTPEPLFVTLLRDAVFKVWGSDPVMSDFVNFIAGPLSEKLGHIAAKGGEFSRQKLEDGDSVVERYINDQSMRAHIINGLLPVLNIARALSSWKAPQFRAYDEITRRCFIAGYVLHDYLKLPNVEHDLLLAGFEPNSAINRGQIPVVEQIFLQWSGLLGIDKFLQPIGGMDEFVQDLIYIACNTQVRWGTLRNLSLLNHINLSSAQLLLSEGLSHLSDLLAYVIRTPLQALQPGLQDDLSALSGGLARFANHHLSDNRGVLTNFIQNAALEALAGEFRLPVLYAPSGVIYLEHKKLAPTMPSVESIAETTIRKIKTTVGQQLAVKQSGFKRDGKGIKYADYYWLFFDLPAFLKIGIQATFKVINPGKLPSSGKRFAKMKDGNWMPGHVDLDLPERIEVDQLAEWCFLAEAQVSEHLPDFPTGTFLLHEMGLDDLEELFKTVPRDNRAGGVGYHWYFAAGNYIKRNPGLSPEETRETVEKWGLHLANAVRLLSTSLPTVQPAAWENLKEYIQSNLTLGGSAEKNNLRFGISTELTRYSNAKRKGRGGAQVCALCSSHFEITKQREAAVLFAPQVYSNKKLLSGSDPIRDICSICSIEMMIRQIMMNRSSASGGDFEGRRIRYLFFYPMYFFTPETIHVVRRMTDRLKRLSFTDLQRQLLEKGKVQFSPEVFQRLQEFMLLPDQDFNPETDHYVRLHFPATEPVSFYFIGIPPPSRKPKDAEAWIHPAIISLILPLCLDLKVVVSESPIPLLLDADEIHETVFLDGAHAAINYLTGGLNLINIDQVLPIAQKLMASYFIHVDANATSGAGGFDYRWQDIPAVARALAESPLYAFYYLKKWQRKQKIDTLPEEKVRVYLQYYRFLGVDLMMNHARTLTQLYRQFYRAKRWNSNSILRPINIAAHAILDADPQLFNSPEALSDVVYGTVHAFIDRAYREQLAFPPRGSTRESQQMAMREFSDYLVKDIFYKVFRGDQSALRGKQLNLLRDACEVIYLDESAKDRAERDQVEIEVESQ